MKILISFLLTAVVIIVVSALIYTFIMFEQWIYSMFGFAGTMIVAVATPLFIGFVFMLICINQKGIF